MGNYADVWLDDFELGSSPKDDVDLGLLGLFRPSDRRAIANPWDELPHHLTHHLDDCDDDSTVRIVYFEAPTNIVRDRLELAGYTLPTSIEAFNNAVRAERQRYGDWAENPQNENEPIASRMRQHYKTREAILDGLTADSWIAALHEIRRKSLSTEPYGADAGLEAVTQLGYIRSHNWPWKRFPRPNA